MQAGSFEAARARNPNLASWNKQGPVWGVADGCTYRLVFNNQSAPFDSLPAHQAIAALINREQIVDLAWEGAAPVALAPFSSYLGMQAYTKQLEGVIKDAVGEPDAAKAAKTLTDAGFSKGTDGHWRLPGGQPWQVTINTQQGDPVAPIVARQLQAGGIDAVFKPLADAQYFDALQGGTYNTAIFQHCGSLYDPWQTLEHFHSKYAAAHGARATNLRAITRYRNPELDALLNQMEARQPSAADPAYMALVKQATAIVLRDVPQVSLNEELHTLVMNNTYWTGWPSAADPYVAPYPAWDGYSLVIYHLKARQ